MQLRKAIRQQVKLKLNLSAPSGAGKTYSALLLAKGLVGDWSKIAVIDTENGSAGLYSHLGEFNVLDLAAPYTPERYIEAINICTSSGAECVIIDSCSHEWSGAGGCVEINEKIAQVKYKGNTWSAWNETTPRHDRFVQAIMQANVHVIACTRSKMETVQGENKKIHKLGLKDQQRDGWEYEFSISLHLDRDTHLASASKDRTGLFEGKDSFIINEQTGADVLNWCTTGVDLEKEAAIKLEVFLRQIEASLTSSDLEMLGGVIAGTPFNDMQLSQLKFAYSQKLKSIKHASAFLSVDAANHESE